MSSRLPSRQASVLHFAEFGVVMMLFLIGLELRPNRLWQLRRPILGLGGLQVLLAAGEGFGVFNASLVGTATLVVALSMLLTPLLLLVYEKRFSRCAQQAGSEPEPGEMAPSADVIIVGRLFGAHDLRPEVRSQR